MLQPIDMSNEYDGIKMEVIAAMNDDEVAVIYVTLQNLIGDRIDETTELYDYSFTGERMFTTEMVDFDEHTKMATLRIQGNSSEKLNNKKMNLSIDSFLSQKETFESVLDIDTVGEATETISLDMNNIPGGGGNLYEVLAENDVLQVLKPNGTKMQLPEISFMHISNIGIIDQRLHIQVKWDEENVDDHGEFYFKNDFDNKNYSSSVNFDIDESGQTAYGSGYTEYIFDLGQIKMEEQSLFGSFTKNGQYVEGDWNSTFKMTAVQEEISDSLDKILVHGLWIIFPYRH